MKEGTLYPVLYRLEDAGYIESYWEEKDAAKRGAPRKYYRITQDGRTREQELKADLRHFIVSIQHVLGGDV
ncbi:lineage-specific thermal regulator protein [compost metagenome]